MITTVTFNPSLDYIVKVENFAAGNVNRTKEERIIPGGKGINVSKVLKNLGVESTAIGFAAGFSGEELLRLIKEDDIKTDFIKVKNGLTRINVKISSDMETEVNGSGPLIEKEDIDILYKKLDNLKEGDYLVLAGSTPKNIDPSIYRDICKRLNGKKVKIVVDATSSLLTQVLEYKPFLIKPNNYELGEIFGVDICGKTDALKYAKKLTEMGALNVLISMGGKGAVLVDETGREYMLDAPKGKALYTVGAGDSMIAGFIWGYLKNNSYEEAFKMGLCTGSATAFSKGLANKEKVEELYKNIN